MVISFYRNILHHHFTKFRDGHIIFQKHFTSSFHFFSRWSFNCCMILQWLTCSPTCLQSSGTTTLRRMTRWTRGRAIPRADGHLLRWFLCGAPGRAVAPLSRRGTGWDPHVCCSGKLHHERLKKSICGHDLQDGAPFSVQLRGLAVAEFYGLW